MPCPICQRPHKRSPNGPCPRCYMRAYRATETGHERSRVAQRAADRRWWDSLSAEEKLAYGRKRRFREVIKEV